MADTTKSRTGQGSPARPATRAKREAPSRRREREKLATQPRLPFTRKNWTIIGAGLLVILLGFFALSRGSITLAPFLLVGGYCVLLPLGILLPGGRARGADAAASSATSSGTGE